LNILNYVLKLKGLDQATMIAGFLLANSADNLSYVDEVKVLTPFSICLKKNQLHPKFHTGESRAEAVALAEKELTENKLKSDAWAFAREGTFDEEGQLVHTISISAWARGMQKPVFFIQRFERIPRFRLIAEPIIGVDGVIVDAEQSKPILINLRKGVALHEDGGSKWSSWH
jgi:hypothetical protein